MTRQVDHVTVRVKDREAAEAFYGATLGKLGLARNVDDHGRVSFGNAGGDMFGFYSEGDEFYKQPHVAFVAPSRAAVDRVHAAALHAGGVSLSGPRDRPEFGGLYSAYLSDPDGAVVEIVFDPSRS